ncbi:hypothetical protein ABL78_6003 [Leptomonas seymouri]|uniref:FYVE-type domain-containing protein n=1 Tax=Leptomonas seymouri TaxID=5684 RepID=A0A0N0P465_LEPSE|nr:hypothetical protein ABL78_6003 [Leptomonas seymouri]|eukprot:KPI84936.1 hypothetical protein ABL78_6003 [Leptomonas seymouri]
MSQTPKSMEGEGGSETPHGDSCPSSSAPQYYDLSAPLTRPVTALQVSGFTLRVGMLPSLIVPDGSLYFGPVVEDGRYRVPSGCGIILFRLSEGAPPSLVLPSTTSSDASNGGIMSYFFGRGTPRVGSAGSGNGKTRAAGQSAADFTALCKQYQQGDRYGGDWRNGVFHGEGVLVTSSFTYQGGWREGLMHGKGTASYTRKHVDARPAAATGAGGESSSGGVGTLLLKGLSYVTPFDLVATAAAPKEYIGAFHADHGRHGAGLMCYYNGDVYEGEWRDNCRHGKGKLRKLDGETYEGDWVSDERHGYGKIMYPNGSLFKGLMRHGQRSGEGVMRFANGDEYFGSFESDRIEGRGTMKYRNGDIYDGAWYDQLRHGQGSFTLKRTGATMTGNFQNGLIQGEATVVVPGVSTFVGTFVRGERTVGTMHWHPQRQSEGNGKDASVAGVSTDPSSPVDKTLAAATSTSAAAGVLPPASASLSSAARKNYLCYQGEWHGEHMNGKGLLWYTNGDFFAGSFQKSYRHGPGNMRYAAEQAEFSGQFVHGMRHGVGLLQRADGSILAGRWQQDLFVEGYEGEWDGTAFHGIGRLTIPIDTFFCLRASNATLKLTDINAVLNDTSSPPPPPLPPLGNAADEDELRSSSSGHKGRLTEGGSHARPHSPGDAAAAAVVVGDVMRRASFYPHFIDFFGLFRGGVRDGVGMLKLPALDCLVGGTLSPVGDRRGTGKTFLQSSSTMSGSPVSGGGASSNKWKFSSSSTSPLPGDTVPQAAGVPSMVIKGRWVREVLHCEKGVLAFPNGIVYIGGFHNGTRDATCARVWLPDGSVMESGWRDDAPSGPGVWYKRNRMEPVFQTTTPSVLRRSLQRHIPDTQTPASASTEASTKQAKRRTDNGSSTAGDQLGLSYLWGLVGLGFGNGGGSNETDGEDSVKADSHDDEEDDKPRRILVDFQSHFAMSGAWYPCAMDLSTYARVALTQIAARTAPLANGTPWPLTMHSATALTAVSNSATQTAASSSETLLKRKNSSSSALLITNAASVQQEQQSVPPTARQIAAGAAALHLAEPPPRISLGRANGPAVVYFESGVVLAGEWLSNAPRLAVPYRPWSAYDNFLAWQASRPAARNCMKMFPLLPSPRTQSCYTALLAVAPDDVQGEPKRTTPNVYQSAASMASSPLAMGGSAGVGSTGVEAAPAVAERFNGVTTPETRCTLCAKEYSFFRKRTHCTLCLRSTCPSCLGSMDTDGQQQEDMKAILRHAHVTSEQAQQLAGQMAAAAAKSSASSTLSHGSNAAHRAVFPSISVEHVDRAFDAKSVSTLPVCADCVRALLWKLRYTQLWIPTSMFSSVMDIDRHQRDTRARRKASAQAVDTQKAKELRMANALAGGAAAAAAATTTAADPFIGAAGEANAVDPLASVEEPRHESPRQFSTSGEPLPASSIAHSEVVQDVPHTPTSQSTIPMGDGLEESPVPNPSPLSAEAAVAAGGAAAVSPVGISTGATPYTRTPPARRHPSGELLPPAQYITFSGYTSHTIPHIYGELWWGRRFYYRGGFCAGERHGFGVQYMPNGERYEGAFRRDAWHGPGVYYLEDGSVLMGEFRRGELSVVQYHGEVEEDAVHGVRPHGRGIGYGADASVYNGEWVHGKRHGTGMLHLPDGVSVYSGTFMSDAMEGLGKLVTTSGAYYGGFSQNQQHGKGLLFTSSCVVEGSWVHGASSGFTRIYENDTGEVYETTYRDGNERDDCFPVPLMIEDADAAECGQCGAVFSFFLRRHHCRLCGDVFCDACSQHRATLPMNFSVDGDTGAGADGLSATISPNTTGQRVCDACLYRLTQRRMIALHRYKDGSIYAGCWSQGRWVSRGLYCRPDGIYVVMDTRGHPLITADWSKARMATVSATGITTDSSNSNAEEQGKRESSGVPPGGLGVSRRPARTVLPVSPSILQDASPAKEVLDNAITIKESSSREDLDAFLMWWATTSSRCGLQVPLDVLLVSKYQHMPAQLLRGGKSATVTIGSEAAAYLVCPAQCTLSTPCTPSLGPIHLFVTLADSRKSMQAMVDGEVAEHLNRGDPMGGNEGAQHRAGGARERGSLTTTPMPQAPRWTVAEQRTVDSDVEAAMLRASRFMPVAIPRAPTVPITAATIPTTSMAVHAYPTELSGSACALDQNRTAEQQQETVGLRNSGLGSSFNQSTEAAATLDVQGSAFGLTAWATRTPPSIDDEDITDEKLMAMIRAERLAWPSTTASSSAVGPLMPPTPAPPQPGENTTIAWSQWTTRETPHYAPPPLVPVQQGGDDARRSPNAPTTTSSAPSAMPPSPQPQTEADLYFACSLWEPTVPDAQMLLEQGKMIQAARLMRRLQREHLARDKNSGSGSEGTITDDDDDDDDDVWMARTNLHKAPNAAGDAKGKKRNDGLDTLDVLKQMQAASGTGAGGSWTAGRLLSAEQRAQSGGGWAPAPMHGPFTFSISTSQKYRSADGQRWCFAVHQQEIDGS